MFRVHMVALALIAGCGSDELFSLEGFNNSVSIEQGSTASFYRHGHDVEGVVVIGDIDGDGIDDAIVSTSEFTDYTWNSYHLVYGGGSGGVDLDSLPKLISDADSPLPNGDIFVPLGDIDGDGLADFAVGKTSGTMCDGYHGSSGRDGQHKGGYIIYGSSARLTGDVPLASIGVTIQDPVLCTGQYIQFGRLGDIDGDGLDDVGVLDYGSDYEPITASKAYVFYGRHDRLTGVVDITTADAVLEQVGDDELDSTVSLGDLDGDGRADFAVKTYSFAMNTSSARIIYSSATRLAGSSAIDATPSTVIPPTSCQNLSALGDLDGDGFADVAVLSCEWPFDLSTPSPPGMQYIFYGRAGRFPDVLDNSTADATIAVAPDGYDSVLASGDVDGDGIRDLVMSDPGLRDDSGAIYVMPGTGTRLAGPIDMGPTGTAIIGHQIRVQCYDGGDGCSSGQFVGAELRVGDLTGDHLLDALVTAPTQAFLGQGDGTQAYLISPASIR